MKRIQKQILGILAFILLSAGFASAANLVDPLGDRVDTKEEIKEFTAFCTGGGDGPP